MEVRPTKGWLHNGPFGRAQRAVRKSHTPYIGPLPRGAIAALNTLRWRVPEDAPESVKTMADVALQRIVDVLEGRVPPELVQSTLAAARAVREEVCGPPTKTLKVDGRLGLATLLGEMEELEKADPQKTALMGPSEQPRERTEPARPALPEAVVVSDVDPEPGNAS